MQRGREAPKLKADGCGVAGNDSGVGQRRWSVESRREERIKPEQAVKPPEGARPGNRSTAEGPVKNSPALVREGDQLLHDPAAEEG